MSYKSKKWGDSPPGLQDSRPPQRSQADLPRSWRGRIRGFGPGGAENCPPWRGFTGPKKNKLWWILLNILEWWILFIFIHYHDIIQYDDDDNSDKSTFNEILIHSVAECSPFLDQSMFSLDDSPECWSISLRAHRWGSVKLGVLYSSSFMVLG